MTEEDLRKFLDDELADLPVGDADDPVNFVIEVVNCLNRWAAAYKVEISLDKPVYCCFVNCERVRQIAEQHGFTSRQYFRDDTPQDLLGQIYLCSPTLQSVFSHTLTAASIHDVTNEIARLGLSSQAVVIFNAATKEAFWRHQLSGEMVPIKIAEAVEQLQTSDFDEELKRFYVEFTATPQGYVKPWRNAQKLLTKERLENEIRDYLCVFLKLKHEKWLTVTRESYEPTGRADLKVYFIFERVSFFLELKVFRAYEQSGKTIKKVPLKATIDVGKMGVAQAHAYRLANDPDGVAYACCYDARGTDKDIDDVKTYADSMNVRYRRYFMYQSSEDFHRSFIPSVSP